MTLISVAVMCTVVQSSGNQGGLIKLCTVFNELRRDTSNCDSLDCTCDVTVLCILLFSVLN